MTARLLKLLSRFSRENYLPRITRMKPLNYLALSSRPGASIFRCAGTFVSLVVSNDFVAGAGDGRHALISQLCFDSRAYVADNGPGRDRAVVCRRIRARSVVDESPPLLASFLDDLNPLVRRAVLVSLYFFAFSHR